MKDESINESFLWPDTDDVPGDAFKESGLFKHDPLLYHVEGLISSGEAWPPISGTTKRTEKTEKIKSWINKQKSHKKSVDEELELKISSDLKLDDFPISGKDPEKRTVTTARNITYLIDTCQDFLACIENGFGSSARSSAESVLDTDIGVFLYVTNSLTDSGRAFKGDPFTGQAAAYSRIFPIDLLNNRVRNFVCYYPHQIYSQFFYKNGNTPRAKGVLMLRSQSNLLITSGGTMIDPKTWKIV